MFELPVLAAGVAYWFGFRRRLRLVGRARWRSAEWRALWFYTGLGLIAVAESPPVLELAQRFFWVRTAEVMLVVMGAGPLLVIGSPRVMLTRLVPRLDRGSAGSGSRRWWLRVIAGFGLLNGALWTWHVPTVYELTMSSAAAIHVTDLLFAVLAVAFWAQVIDQPPVKAPLTYVQRCIYLVAASMQLRFLALVIGFTETPYYAHYVSSNSGGLGALFDQRMGAGVLLVPGVFSDLIALTVCTFLWLADEDRRSPVGLPRDDPGRAALPAAVGWTVTQAFSRR